MPSPAPHRFLHLTHPDARRPGYEFPESASAPLSWPALAAGFLIAVFVAGVGFALEHETHHVADAIVHPAWVTPFALLLLAIAVMPVVAGHFWERHYAKVALALAGVVAAYYATRVEHGPANLGRSLAEYVSFIFLLGSLFIVSGGILIRVRATATPLVNVGLLLTGAVLANVLGTTGASMLLIRPYLRMNRGHLRPYHVVFFIFVVSNAGGSLTPIGDPPLFLGYLQGVPFFWVFEHCWPIWAAVNGVLLAIFFVFDVLAHRRDARTADAGEHPGPAVSVYGAANFGWVALIVAGILLHARANALSHAWLGFEAPWREWAMCVAAFGSLATTPRRVHGGNHFNYAPVREVALLFVGIFVTMVPVLNTLAHNAGRLHLTKPGHYYFLTGGLSSVLDNAPTYLTLLKAELSTLDETAVARVTQIVERPGHAVTDDDVAGLSADQAANVRSAVAGLVRYHADRVNAGTLSPGEIRVGFLLGDPALNRYLVAISMGAVLFGAMTYIGNGPNFMVKAVAEHAGAPVPGFFAYVLIYALPVLGPLLVGVWYFFLR